MNHLWIAYDALLVTIGAINVLLLFLARGHKPFLVPLAGFYAAFALSLFVAMSRRYVVFNVEGTHSQFVFWAYGIGTLLSYLVLVFIVPTYHQLLGWSRQRLTRLLAAALSVAALLGISPWSVEFAPDGQSYLLKWGHYAAGFVYFSVFTYVMYMAVHAAMSVSDARDRLFARVLLAFGAVGYVESSLSLIAEIANRVEGLGAEGEYFLFSSVPYAIFSAFLAAYMLPLVSPRGDAPAESDRTKVEALGLSEREREVLELLLKGSSNKAIANELHISEATVKTHLNKIFRKANVRSRFELARSVVGGGGGPPG
ncbi:DNA-binding NarL/FixJ family response regulator [Povalibacter uvarum]|uniref:DNA-binding NarL/FixJ family response regulator n=1 Tax=Povalibacter uvarum TaxID=732238 RepID=A0A841HFS8_9GAMM|nr:response regulator transcription factor [Povalibacter uvarum]MBB6091210.1 DNA-binding NarL/FixJ family response regulator [Povalibacter uvarum]